MSRPTHWVWARWLDPTRPMPGVARETSLDQICLYASMSSSARALGVVNHTTLLSTSIQASRNPSNPFVTSHLPMPNQPTLKHRRLPLQNLLHPRSRIALLHPPSPRRRVVARRARLERNRRRAPRQRGGGVDVLAVDVLRAGDVAAALRPLGVFLLEFVEFEFVAEVGEEAHF
ncbi:hypothetical protein BDY17DRAFT_288305 [Neohortaea acidophila]|uniref:Uncharacterized protein n=1 Tax=Neohortaea acidophila TaxID=245834 RepID=A0A6A6Q472_9PEZI|nr:uncharacterized protein BDY17DRAFT_288305 [Neohortaea acidophila]KAF2487082.1 hypothetical protein BDY17DRAFT_288305 [Neohortaea acidophila]